MTTSCSRPYKVPTFEEIFEKDHSATTETAQQVVLNLRPHNNHGMKFPNVLSENNRNSQIEAPASGSHIKYLYEDIFESAPQITSTTMSYQDVRKQKLLELAKQELMKKQKLKSQRIKSQQKQDQFLKLTKYLQQQKKKSVKSPRSQQLDSFFSKIQGFGSSKTSQLKSSLIKKYQNLIKKSDKEPSHIAGWKQDSPGLSKINGQQYLDKSMETKILDGSLQSGLPHIASLRHPVHSSRHDVVTTGEDIITLLPPTINITCYTF